MAFCAKQTNNMINKLHERTLIIRSLVLNDQTSNFETLFDESSDICNHHRNIQTIKMEAYTIQNKLTPPVMKNRLERKTMSFNLRNPQELGTQRNETLNSII